MIKNSSEYKLIDQLKFLTSKSNCEFSEMIPEL